jgi:Methane oxygenase PmoA
MKRWFASVLLSLAAANAGRAQEDTLRIDVTTDKHGHHAPLCIPLSIPQEWAKFDEVSILIITGKDPGKAIGQLTRPGITTESIKPAKEGLVRRDLHLVLPDMPEEKLWTLVVSFKETQKHVTRFAWTEKKGEYQELVLTRSGSYTPLLRYMNRPYDTSSADARNKSYKVFHHLYDPAGKRFVTNGGFTNDGVDDPKNLLYPHHRGIMYGFNKCSYGPDLKAQADTWHCPAEGGKKKVPNAAHVAQEKTLGFENGPVLGRHRVLLGWYGAGDKPFAQEERELTVYNIKGGTLVEFASRLTTTGGKVRVDGDPQHAGFQFRAHNDVSDKKVAAQTYYLRPDGKGKFGETRNWDPKTKQGPVDLPWYAMSFVLGEQRYTTCCLNHPSNPKETRFSERDYGRFGGYFQRDITEEQPLVVNYRLWLQTGEMTGEQAESLRTAFASPPKCVVK